MLLKCLCSHLDAKPSQLSWATRSLNWFVGDEKWKFQLGKNLGHIKPIRCCRLGLPRIIGLTDQGNSRREFQAGNFFGFGPL